MAGRCHCLGIHVGANVFAAIHRWTTSQGHSALVLLRSFRDCAAGALSPPGGASTVTFCLCSCSLQALMSATSDLGALSMRLRIQRSMDFASLLNHFNHTHRQHNGQATVGQGVPSLAIACDRPLRACVTGGGLLVVDLSGHELPRWVMHEAISSDYLVIILRWFPCEGTVATVDVGRCGRDALQAHLDRGSQV
jgi:hypothetical protein